MTSPGILHFFPHMLRWASACHLRGVERGVAQIGAFYSNGCILKGSVNERKGISPPTHPLSATLASTSHSRQKNTATLTCRKEVTVSGTLEKFGQCWQRSVLCLQSTVCQLFFSFFFFCYKLRTPTLTLPICLFAWRAISFLAVWYRWLSWLWWDAVFIVSHTDKHFLLTATSGRSLPSNDCVQHSVNLIITLNHQSW